MAVGIHYCVQSSGRSPRNYLPGKPNSLVWEGVHERRLDNDLAETKEGLEKFYKSIRRCVLNLISNAGVF